MNAVKAVANGVALLHKEIPGWTELIEVSDLELDDQEYCVLGQVFGSYSKGLDALFGCAHYTRNEQAQQYGFTCTPEYSMECLQEAYFEERQGAN